MSAAPRRISLAEWTPRREELLRAGLSEPPYGGPLSRHVDEGDTRLCKLSFDNSAAALRLWNFLLTEEQRLRQARAAGKKLVGAMKDLGTVAAMAYALEGLTAFYPDGAWWIPCIMERNAELLELADAAGVGDAFCPVRAMLGAFINQRHFPLPDLLICSVGAVCDDFSAIAQRVAGLGFQIHWWEMPHRRRPEPGAAAAALPGGFQAPADQVALVAGELAQVRDLLAQCAGEPLTDERLAAGIARANGVRRRLAELRELAFAAPEAPLPALELLIAEMLALHYCSDACEAAAVLQDLLDEARRRAERGTGPLPPGAVRVFWVNPVADLRVMNLLEDAGGRVCGTEYLFCHTLDLIPEDLPPLEALARTALADPMVGSMLDRGRRIALDARRFGAEAVVISAIPGASHCAWEGAVLAEYLRAELGLPLAELEVPPLSDAVAAGLGTRLEALIETAKTKRSV